MFNDKILILEFMTPNYVPHTLLEGECVDIDGNDQIEGQIKISNKGTVYDCLLDCQSHGTGGRGCEWNQDTGDCFQHENEVYSSTDTGNHVCIVYNDGMF